MQKIETTSSWVYRFTFLNWFIDLELSKKGAK